MALARSRRLGIADLLGLVRKNEKERHFPLGTGSGAIGDDDSHGFFTEMRGNPKLRPSIRQYQNFLILALRSRPYRL
jgi:hypothetical protein